MATKARIKLAEGAVIPSIEKGKATGFDLRANIYAFKERLVSIVQKAINNEEVLTIKHFKGIKHDVEFVLYSGLSYRLSELVNFSNKDYIFETIDEISCIKIPKGSRCLINTGVHIQFENDLASNIRPRSGLGLLGIIPVDGTIDNDYTGDIGVNLYNFDYEESYAFPVEHGDRIAQLVIELPITNILWEEVDDLENTERGTDGFNSTGVK